MGNSDSSTPTFVDYGGPAGAREAYPAWSTERHIPLSKEEIEDIFLDLTQKFGFQRDSMRNMVSVLPYHTTATITRRVLMWTRNGAQREKVFKIGVGRRMSGLCYPWEDMSLAITCHHLFSSFSHPVAWHPTNVTLSSSIS
jgi:hypothetical protein